MLRRLTGLRDRLFADPGFRRRVGALPLGRRIANRHATRLFGIVSGFVQSQMLAAGCRIGLFDALQNGAVGATELAARLGLPDRGFAALIQATIAMGLIERRGDALALTIDGLVIATDPGIRAMVSHNALLYRDLADPVAMLRAPGGGTLGAFWPYAGGDGDAAGYSALMATSQRFVADAILAAVDFSRFESIADVGGGDGSFLAAVAVSTSRPRLTLVDLPPVLAIARKRLMALGAADRIGTAESIAAAPSPDAVTLIRVIHDRDDREAVSLLREAAAALRPGGRLIIAEPIARDGIDPQAAYFAAYFLAMGSGRLRTRAELAALLRAARLSIRSVSRSFLVDVIQVGHIEP